MLVKIVFRAPSLGSYGEAFGDAWHDSTGERLEFAKLCRFFVAHKHIHQRLHASLQSAVEREKSRVAGNVAYLCLRAGQNVHDPPLVGHVTQSSLTPRALDGAGKPHDMSGIIDTEFWPSNFLGVACAHHAAEPLVKCSLGFGVGNLSTK